MANEQQDILQILGNLIRGVAENNPISQFANRGIRSFVDAGQAIGRTVDASAKVLSARPGVEGEGKRIVDELLSNQPKETKKVTGAEAIIEEPEEILGLNAEAVKAVQDKNRKLNATEAVEQLGPEKAMQAAVKLDSNITDKGESSVSQEGGSINQMELLKKAGVNVGLLSKLFGRDLLPGNTASQLGNIGSAQTVLGQEPIQEKDILEQTGKFAIERQKIEIKQDDAFIKAIREPISAETVKALNQTEFALTALNDITELLGITTDPETGFVDITNKSLLRNANFLNKQRQTLKRARDIFINKSLRRDSGAVISKDEEVAFRKTFGFEIGMKAFLQNPEVIAKAIIDSQNQLTRDRNRLAPNDSKRQEFQSLIDQGFSERQIVAEFRRRGEI